MSSRFENFDYKSQTKKPRYSLFNGHIFDKAQTVIKTQYTWICIIIS